jgi:hypothetical protein
MTVYRPVHPFPARMAPDLAAKKVARLPRASVVLDPMMGSGTFPLVAGLSGHTAYGLDSDPLAVLIAQAAASDASADDVLESANCVIESARRIGNSPLEFDSETAEFIRYWFDDQTANELGCLASAIQGSPVELHSPLWCAFSRLIITKDAGASRARDVSHSRPHRTRETAAFSPLDKFVQAVTVVLRRRVLSSWRGAVDDFASEFLDVHVMRGDARMIPLPDSSVDAVMTSPPYLVAIDYLRGHRMSLVWMGYSVRELRVLRASNIGSERGTDLSTEVAHVVDAVTSSENSLRARRVVNNYVTGLAAVIREVARVLKQSGLLTMVISDAKIEGRNISVERIVTELARDSGLELHEREVRVLPSDRRYLPPPTDGAQQALLKRMRQEVVLSLAK